MGSSQQYQELSADVEQLRARIRAEKIPGMSPAMRFVALVLAGTLARLFAGEIDPQFLSQSLGNGFGGFV